MESNEKASGTRQLLSELLQLSSNPTSVLCLDAGAGTLQSFVPDSGSGWALPK